MSVPLTPSKRPNDRGPVESNGKGKWQKLAGVHSSSQALKVSPGSVVFRLLCLTSKIGSVIGKGGTIISEIRQETGVKVKVEDTIPGCDERVITTLGSDKDTEEYIDQSKEVCNQNTDTDRSKEVYKENADTDRSNEVCKENTDSNGKGDKTEEHHHNNDNKDSIHVEDSQCEKRTFSVQKALLLIFERIVEGEEGTTEGGDESKKPSSFVFRLLVFSSQIGCVLGKSGSVIKQMSADSGAQIRILPRDKLPLCASSSDELVQITGGVDAVRKALQSVSQQLLENPPRDQESLSVNPTGPSSHSFGQFQPPNRSFTAHGGPYCGISCHPRSTSAFTGNANFSFIVSIGKGGAIIKIIQQETASEINVIEGISDPEDRIVIISGPAHPDDRISPVQDVVLRVQTRIVRASPDAKEHSMLARIIVSSNQIGCLLGKGGSVVAEMRKLSGAYIRISRKDQVPKSVSEDEVVQISGDFNAVQDALLQITTRLRHHFFRDAYPSINYPSNSGFLDQVPPFPMYMRREFSPPGMYAKLGPPFHKFDAVGAPPPHGHGHFPHDDHPPFMHNVHRPGVPHHVSERKPWSPQGLIEGGGPVGYPEFAGGPPRRISGFVGGSHQPIITSTTIEVVVPRTAVPVIYGEDGECFKRIRQIFGESFIWLFMNCFSYLDDFDVYTISDAKVTITEPKPGAVETTIIISGTPEQTHAAQSLIQAFVMSERESS
ncbi:hypothetical protein L6164_024078 [Bauhinia variegata]|uniref:Uncharacterized protein n=1 Tax=Bauhinia variegata TaxID=167791 RepID=A0ACB9LXL3_BAUVA|nr:hypothetical protein L6164_024078 [Bauhinia variegata]